MGLSFEDSLKKNATNNIAATRNNNIAVPAVMSVDDMNIDSPSIMTLNEMPVMAAYSGDDGDWHQHTGYAYYAAFSDDNISTISATKDIKLDGSQFNITQEENSQYIPFEMNRYYDGYDLVDAALSIHYETKSGRHGAVKPINVTYSTGNGDPNSAKIRFGWLVDAGATLDAGTLGFEIHAYGVVTGVDENGKSITSSYTWKTKPNKTLNVLQSLCDCEEVINKIDDDTWVQTIVEGVALAVAEKIADAQVGTQVARAEAAAASAKESADNAASAATTAVTNALADYSTTTQMEEYVADAIADADIEGKLTDYAKTSEVETLVGDIGDSENVVDYIDTTVATVASDVGTLSTNIETLSTDISTVSNKFGNLVDDENNPLTVEAYVNKKVEEVDVSEQIGDLGTDNEGNPITNVVDYVDKKVGDVDVSEQLKNYYTKDATYNRTEIDDKLKNVSVDLTGYATESYVDAKIGESNTPINAAITTINQSLESIDKSPRVTYDATYGDVELDDGSTAEYMFTLWKTENGVREVQDRFQIAGGGGGGAGSVILRIAYVEGYTTPLVSTVDEQVIVKYNFSGEDSAGDTNLDGVASWKVGNRVVATEEVSTGECEFDLTDYVTVGDNKVMLTITHATGAVATKAWTVKVVDVRLESTFDDTKVNTANEPVTFTFTPYGGVNKIIHFCLDGEEIDSKTSSAAAAGLSDSFVIPTHAHGTHLFEIYMTADVNGKAVESNHIVKDIIWYDATSNMPVIGCTQQKFTVRQYEAININYTVYDPSTETPSVSLKSTYVNGDGETIEEYNSNIVMSSNTATWQYKTDVLGEHTLTITCGDIVKTLTATVVELGIDVSPITAGLVFDFNPVGYSNDDANRLWSNGNIAMTVSDDFDWVNGGYQYDENGDLCFCIKAGTSAEINYELFGDDAKANGKQAKLIFKTKNVSNGETVFLSCVSDTIGTDKIGLEMKAHEATIYAKTDSLPLPYAEEEIVEFEFNITPSSEAPSMVMGYEDGVSTRPLVYDDTHDFQQYQGYRKTITLGSDECDLYIYRFKVYNKSLSDKDILNNFIADARSAEEMIERYDRNQIYKEGVLDPDYLAEMCPQLRIIKLEVPWFTNDKDDKVYDTNRQSIVECVYKGGDPIYDNWVAYDIVHSGQGTSSNNYGAAGRNLDLILKSYKDYGNAPYIILGDGSRVNKVSLTRESIPVNYFNVKVNIASSENANNALMQKRYNQYNPYNRPFVREDASIIPYIKDTMEFQNCVIFVKESDTVTDGQGNYINHREFNDNNWHFYAIGNIGDSKKTDSSRLTDPSDPYECILEVMDNTLPNSTMPTGKVDINGTPIYPINPSEWTVGNSAYDSLYADKFDESKAADKDNGLADTYGWRYIYEDGTDEENAEVKAYVEQKWKDFYEFVVTSTDEEFKEHLGDWCVLNSVMYYYLFVLRYTLTDNFSKNSFWHYGKSNDLDSEGNPIRKWDLCFDYDNDTCLGIDNYGRMTYRYGYEEIDYVDGTKDWVWNAPNHVFFLRLRKLFDEELCDLYTTLESSGCWSATSLINQWNDWQAQFPEELWRLDIQRKYIRTYTESFINGKAYPEFLTERANGRKKTQRSQFERNQEKYMSSKFGGTVASADDIILRCSVPNTALVVEPNFDITLTAFSHIYASVKYNTDLRPYKYRLKPNETYTFEYNADLADIIEIYSASCMKDIGDLSACYLTNGTFANATKITELILGNKTEGYNNTNVMTLGLGSNELLDKLDIQNMSGLTHSLDLSGLKNLEELYAFGSGTSGVIFADGGNIRIAEIPDVGALQMKNLSYLTDDGFESTSYYSLSRLVAENSELDLINLINNSPNLRQVRLTGVDWALDDTSLLERLYNLAGVTNTGGNIDQSVLTGKVHVPTIKQKQLLDYQKAWSDLDITYDEGGLILQHPVTFVNYDGTPLYTQYVDEGGYAVDPVENGDIPTPTRESTVSTDYTYIGWNDSLTGQIWEAKTVTAQYSETIRKYTIKYVVSESGKETVLQESVGEYGTNVPYTGKTPTYDLKEGENGWTYYLFNRWDKSGFIDSDKTVTAIFDICRYTSGLFNGRPLSDLSPVEIYALTKLTEPVDKELSDYGMSIETGDDYSFTMGYDVDYDDIDSDVIIPTKRVFSGTTNDHYDTGITLFDEDKDFVIALDYKMMQPLAGVTNATLMQCYQTQGTNGFKLSYASSPVFAWGGVTTATDGTTVLPSATDNREMLVIRHKKGDNNLYIYTSNLNSTNIKTYTIARDIATQSDTATLVFGAAKADNGRFGNYAVGEVNWCKIWYKDLGENVCKNLVSWTHEKITLETSGFHRYQLYDDPNKESMMSLLATHLLSVQGQYNAGSNDNAGGWKDCKLNRFLNSRFYNAIPYQIKALIKKVSVKSTVGDNSSATDSSGCYINIPALYDIYDGASAEYKGELYEFASTIDFFTGFTDATERTNRVRDFDGADLTDGGFAYWLRSPSIGTWSTSRYCYSIDASGNPQQVTGTSTNQGILIEISF